MAQQAPRWRAALLLLLTACCALTARGVEDAMKQAELSRWIREHFRRSGMQWVSPKMFKNLKLSTNTKPIMFVFTMQSCGDCRRIMNEFVGLDDITLSGLSSQFVAVLVLDDYNQDFLEPQYDPLRDKSIPRVLFAHPNGTVRPELINPRAERDGPYYYNTAAEIMEMMREVLAEHDTEQNSRLRTRLGLPPVAEGSDPFPGDLPMDL